MKYLHSLNNSLVKILQNDKKSFVIGEDIHDPYGGEFKVTKNLSSSFKKQTFSTPISESAITGIASGMALKGHKVILEIMFGDFLTLIVDQVHNGISKSLELQKNRKFGSLTIRTPMGGYRGYGCTHSQSIETLFMNTPNIEIYSPNAFIDPGKLLKKIVNENKLSLFIEHKLSYSKECEIKSYDGNKLIIDHKEDYSKIRIFDEDPKFTIITYGYISELGLRAIHNFFIENEINGELIVLNKIKNFSLEFLDNLDTNLILTLEEGVSLNGWGKLISSTIYEKKFGKLEKPIINIGAKSSIIPSSIEKEKNILPSVSDIEKGILNLTQIN